MNYVPVRISTLKSHLPLKFNVYVKLPSKYLLYVKNGDEIEKDRIQNLKKKKVRKLFITESDEQNYQEFLDECLSQTMTDENVSMEEKTQVVIGVSETAAQDVYEDPQSAKAYKAAKRASDGLVKVMNQNDGVLKAILKRTEQESEDLIERIQAHAVNTSSLCVAFGEFIGLDSSPQERLALASLYHDIGFLKVSPEAQEFFFQDIGQKHISELGDYGEHPFLGAQMLQDKEFATPEILDLIKTHEERVNGTGFPKKLQKLPLEQEVHALCCYYDRRVTCLKQQDESVINDLMINEIGNFNLETLTKFKKFLKTNVL